MLFSVVSLLALGAASLAHPVLEQRADGCNADNVLRLLRATQRVDDSIAFCSQYLDLPLVTATAAALPTASVTITEIRTTTVTETFVQTQTSVDFEKLRKRCTDETHSSAPTTTTKSISTPGFILSTSIDPSRLSSACACLTIPLSTVTITTGVAGTQSFSETKTSTVTTLVFETTTTTITGPSRVLTHATSVPTFTGVAQFDIDDAYYRVELPFEVEVYGFKSNLVFVSINGLIWLDENSEGNYWYYYTNGDSNGADLPLAEPILPDVAILPFWSDLYINGGHVQNIWYETSGSPGSMSVTFEYLVSAWGSTDDDYHFTVTLSENSNKVGVHYYYVADSAYGTVAVQHESGNEAIVYSRNEDIKVHAGLEIEFDTSAGTVSTL